LAAGQTRPVYSFVVPLFNEEATLPILLRRLDQLVAGLDAPAEIILVDDGSTDTTGIVAAARAKDDPAYRYLALSRNFGHQTAITAGMDHAAGDAVIVMDADLQDPPEVVPAMIAKWKEGFEIVNAQRLHREGETKLKIWTAALFMVKDTQQWFTLDWTSAEHGGVTTQVSAKGPNARMLQGFHDNTYVYKVMHRTLFGK